MTRSWLSLVPVAAATLDMGCGPTEPPPASRGTAPSPREAAAGVLELIGPEGELFEDQARGMAG
jgi:hypothetical protein